MSVSPDTVAIVLAFACAIFSTVYWFQRQETKESKAAAQKAVVALNKMRAHRDELSGYLSTANANVQALRRNVVPDMEEAHRIVAAAQALLLNGPSLQRVKVVTTLDIDLDVFSTNKSLTDYLDAQGAHFAVIPDMLPDAEMPWVLLARTKDGWASTLPGIHTFLYDKEGHGLLAGDANLFAPPTERPMRRRRAGLGPVCRVIPGDQNG